MNRHLAALLLAGACAAPAQQVITKPDLAWPPSCPAQPNITARADPRYPMGALRDGQSGWVLAVYDVLPDGSPANARIVGSNPKGIFDDAVLNAIARLRFEPNSPKQHCPYHAAFNVR